MRARKTTKRRKQNQAEICSGDRTTDEPFVKSVKKRWRQIKTIVNSLNVCSKTRHNGPICIALSLVLVFIAFVMGHLMKEPVVKVEVNANVNVDADDVRDPITRMQMKQVFGQNDTWQHRQCTNELFTCPTTNVHHLPLPLPRTNVKLNDNEKYTILINTWQRNECLTKSINHYLKCSHVEQIRVIWSDPDNEVPDSLRMIASKEPKLRFDEYRKDKLADRFRYNEDWKTNAIFQVDDDVIWKCELLTNTFKLWQLFPLRMIGFAPRVPVNNHIVMGSETYSKCEYSLLWLTIGGFLHKDYYEMYAENDINGIVNGWKSIKDAVNGNVTAEDVSMSLFYSYHSKQAPMAVVVPTGWGWNSCQQPLSEKMHTNSGQKRTNIFLDALKVLGYYDHDFELIVSHQWIDVLPDLKERNCFTP